MNNEHACSHEFDNLTTLGYHVTFSSPLRMRQGQPPALVVSAVFLGLSEHRWILELGAKEGRAALEHFHTSLGMFQSSG